MREIDAIIFFICKKNIIPNVQCYYSSNLFYDYFLILFIFSFSLVFFFFYHNSDYIFIHRCMYVCIYIIIIKKKI